MSTFAGMVHDHLPTPILTAEIDPVLLKIEHGTWILEATSKDGFFYEGNYGDKRVDPERLLQCWVYPGIDGSKMVYTHWHHRVERQTQGESVFRLFPTDRWQSGPAELPEDWTLCKEAVTRRGEIARSSSLELLLVYDRLVGYRGREESLGQWGLPHVLREWRHCTNRPGDLCMLAQRLRDYESNSSGWFSYRWVAVVPIHAEEVDIITPFEDHLLATLRPPENDRGVSR